MAKLYRKTDTRRLPENAQELPVAVSGLPDGPTAGDEPARPGLSATARGV